ncbi:lytic transglycosylase domain-containing protein [Dickeya oryzae]|uniref:lytic transglycosylase domain-containing protein n=1 Tax=Dickeya oryzae TaxID=1240404 RepID=UPI001AECA00A|nr:lytic transglycosylase domain-containing protein [Dickeya oryzae]MBP2845812.1 lytic transglycosylase domain-containing protein [Dickeya oryzae]
MTPSSLLSLAMACAPTVHPDTAHDVARVESGLNPFAIAEIIPKEERKPGEKEVISYFPESKEAASEIIKKIKSRQHRYSVGLMQITSTNFKKYGMTADDLLTPCKNLSVFEKIITDCYLRGGNLVNTLSCYYSGNFITGKKKENKFSGTSYTERIGYNETGIKNYTVPSTKKDRMAPVSAISIIPDKPRKIWPEKVVRGAVSNSSVSISSTSKTVYPATVMRGHVITFNTIKKEINNETEQNKKND